MDKLHEEEILGKAYDWALMKRLLKYARPYWKLLTLSILLLVIITGLELLNPFLIKVAIDDHINGYQKEVYQVPISNPTEGIIIGDSKYISIEDENLPFDRVVLSKVDSDYYLVDSQTKDLESGILLTQEEYLQYRFKDIQGLDRVALIFALVIVLTFIFSYGQIYILNYTSQKIIFNIREELFNHLQGLSIGYFDKNPIGRLVTRVTNDTETLNEMYTNVLVNLFKDFFMIAGIMVVMLRLNVRLALLSFALIPFILLISVIFRTHIREVYRLGRTQLAKINSSLNENISGMRTIQIFKKENKIFGQFDEINSEYLRIIKREVKLFAMFRPSIEIIRSLGIAILVYFGGRNVLGGVIEFGVLYVFINYLQKFFDPILDLTEKYNIMQSAMASSERIFKILDDKSIIENPKEEVVPDEVLGKIEFKNVWFAYVEDEWVLKDISFTIDPGESIAFVGATGAGKTSIINLITRFYDIQKGQILLDGVDIKLIPKEKLRRLVGVVLQDVFIFTGTIKDNIKLNNEISDEKIIEIAKYVNAHHFISRLPNQYDEPVMERGSTLSSGERQLLAFARTLVYDPKILILDEATSNIDTETELLIQDALGKITSGRTSIAIAHRLSTIQHSNKIIVLKSGEIKEMGTHQELLNQHGLYYNLFMLQYKDSFSN